MTLNSTSAVQSHGANGSHSQSQIKTANSNFPPLGPSSLQSKMVAHHTSSYGHLTDSTTSSLDNKNTASKDTLLVLFTFTLISIMLFFTFYFWRKHRERPLATLYKLEEYRYSRLSQNEMEVDSVVFYSDSVAQEQSHNDHINTCNDADNVKAATLHVETDSLITIPNCTSQVVHNLNEVKQKSTDAFDEMSDEDLLQ